MKYPTIFRQARLRGVLALLVMLGVGLWAGMALGQQIDATHKYAWSENTGWQNWKASGGQVSVFASHLEGYIWAENVGWIRLGTHTVGGTHAYTNNSNTTYGVNRSGNDLSGYAWGENIGWINFDSPNGGGVSIDPATGDFSGYAWGENIGWIKLAGIAQDSTAYKVKFVGDGACGAANGVAKLTAPTVGLCAAGTASAVTSAAGSHTWACAGVGGGEGAFCSAPGADVSDVGGSGNATLTLESGDGCTVSSAGLVTPPANGPAGVNMPFGALDFTLTGCTGGSATLTVTYPASAEGMDYWKYINGSWTIMPATISGNTATITIVDNGPFDADPALGIIRDPGGVGMMDDGAGAGPGSATPIPTLSQWAMILLSLLMAGIALVTMRRRVQQQPV